MWMSERLILGGMEEVDWRKRGIFRLYYTHNDEWILCCALSVLIVYVDTVEYYR
jgi:hypothetical protein